MEGQHEVQCPATGVQWIEYHCARGDSSRGPGEHGRRRGTHVMQHSLALILKSMLSCIRRQCGRSAKYISRRHQRKPTSPTTMKRRQEKPSQLGNYLIILMNATSLSLPINHASGPTNSSNTPNAHLTYDLEQSLLLLIATMSSGLMFKLR